MLLGFFQFFPRYLFCLNMFAVTFLSMINYYHVVLLGATKKLILSTFFLPLGNSTIDLEIYLDFYSSQMIWLVSFISLLVHLYSCVYMSNDPRLFIFLTYLTLFTFFMFFFIVSSNYLQLFFGWEGIGLTSYLLVNFWHTRPSANKASFKALLVNRFGDYFLLFAIFIMMKINWSISLVEFNFSHPLMELFLILAAAAKSAQLGLHTWLADAMEGPTPVSALIHAATMVTAGVYLLIRSSTYLVSYSSVLCVLGSLTTVFAGLAAIFQYDLKRVIAYSTCAQLGYMVVAIGTGANELAFYHLVNHAYFKALLFLSAGLVIHGLRDEQDMRRMGGLLESLPFIYTCFIIGSLSLGGLPFFSGYYSKDPILELSYLNHLAVYLFLLAAVYLTVFYSFRLIYLTFYGVARFVRQSPHDSDLFSMLVLVSLFFFALFSGYVTRDLFIGLGQNVSSLQLMESEFTIPLYVKLIPFEASLVGLSFGYLKISKIHLNVWFKFFSYRSGFDFVDSYLTICFVQSSFYFYQNIERGLFEFFGSAGLRRAFAYFFGLFYFSGWFNVFFSLTGFSIFIFFFNPLFFCAYPLSPNFADKGFLKWQG